MDSMPSLYQVWLSIDVFRNNFWRPALRVSVQASRQFLLLYDSMECVKDQGVADICQY